MNIRHYLVIGVFAVALVLFYLFANTRKPIDKSSKQVQPKSEVSTDFAQIVQQVNAQLNKDTLQRIESYLKQPDAPGAMDSVIRLYNLSGFSGVASYYSYNYAQKQNSTVWWQKAGEQNYNAAMLIGKENGGGDLFKNALECYKKLKEADPQNQEYAVKLAQCYMDGTDDVMTGVSLLREVIAKDSNHVEAQFTLGRFGIVSGQFDKAITRLEKVVYLQPSYEAAYFLLAEAYEKSGDKKSAIQSLQRSKKWIKNKELEKEIDEYIDFLKK